MGISCWVLQSARDSRKALLSLIYCPTKFERRQMSRQVYFQCGGGHSRQQFVVLSLLSGIGSQKFSDVSNNFMPLSWLLQLTSWKFALYGSDLFFLIHVNLRYQRQNTFLISIFNVLKFFSYHFISVLIKVIVKVRHKILNSETK